MSARQEHAHLRDAWDGIAARFDEFTTPLTAAFGDEILDQIDLTPGVRLLDVAAGSGALALPAARRGAHVLATDISPAMVERLRTRARAAGLPDLEAAVMDACALDLEDGAFDTVVSLNGVSLLPDVGRGLGEMARVTKPGGDVVVAAFGAPDRAEFIGFFVAALQAVVPGFTGPPMDPPPPPFQLADPARFAAELRAAGLDDVQVETAAWRMELASGDHMWDVVTSSNPIGAAMVADVSPEQQAEVERVLDGMLRERSGGSLPGVLTTDINVGSGRKR